MELDYRKTRITFSAYLIRNVTEMMSSLIDIVSAVLSKLPSRADAVLPYGSTESSS